MERPKRMTLQRNRFNHNRKRNTGLIYEFLTRHMSSQILNKDNNGFKQTYSIVEKYFKSDSPLLRELEIFETLKAFRGIKESFARRIVNEAYNVAKKIDLKELDILKSNLIKDINYTLGKDFYSKYKLNEYRLFASIQMLLDNCRSNLQLSENIEKLKLEESLIGFMTSQPSEIKREFEGKINSLVYSVARDKLSKKYDGKLNSAQTKLLERFGKALLTKQTKAVKEQMLTEKARLLTILRSSRSIKEIKEDEIMRQKLDESIDKLIILDESANFENVVEELLLYEKLAEELKTND